MYKTLLKGKDVERFETLTKRSIGESTAYSAEILFNYAVKGNCKRMLELGTRSGVSTRIFAYACKVTGGHLFSMDIGKYEVENIHRGENWGLNKYITFIIDDDLEVMWNLPIDLLFIDTTHFYEQTLAELQKYSRYVRYGGVILLHDSLFDGRPEGWGVTRAIKTFIKLNPNYIFYETGVLGGLAVLTKNYPDLTRLFGEKK